MENVTDEVIVVPWELERDLPRNQRNLVKALAARPKGIFTFELFKLLGNKNPSSSRFSSRDELKKYGLEIEVEKWADVVQSHWILRKIQPDIINEITKVQEKSPLKIGDKIWYLCCPIINDLISVDGIQVAAFNIDNKEDLNFIINNVTYYTSLKEAYTKKEKMSARFALSE